MEESKKEKYDIAYLERQVNNLSKLVNINTIINSTLDIKKLLKIIMEIIKEIMDTDASTLLLYDEEKNDLVFKVALGESENILTEKYRVKVGQGIAGWVAEQRKATYVNDVYTDRRFDPDYDKKTGYVTRSILCSPLLFQGKFLGVIQAVNPNNRPGFDDEDMRLFRFFADQCALAVQNAIFFQNALEEERMKAEIISAQSIQESLIPDIDRTFKNIQIAAKSFSAREVGGEFYRLFPFDEENLGITLGDIHLKGVPGSIRASIVTGAIMALTSIHGKNPSSLVRSLFRTLADESSSIKNVSVFYGIINCPERKFKFVNAGIAYPILIRNGIAKYLRFGSKKIEDKERDRESLLVSVTLQEGDLFVILTDGILNVKNKNGKNLGLKNVMDFMHGEFSDPNHMIDSLIGFASEFSGESGRKEDISIIAIKAL